MDGEDLELILEELAYRNLLVSGFSSEMLPDEEFPKIIEAINIKKEKLRKGILN